MTKKLEGEKPKDSLMLKTEVVLFSRSETDFQDYDTLHCGKF